MANAVTSEHMVSWDRVLVLETVDKKKPLSSSGLVDSRLFTGENKLHAIKDPQTNLWSFKYEMGGLPAPLKQSFTSWSMLKKFASDYFAKRNVFIKEIIA